MNMLHTLQTYIMGYWNAHSVLMVFLAAYGACQILLDLLRMCIIFTRIFWRKLNVREGTK